MRPSFKLAALAVLSTAVLSGQEEPARPSPQTAPAAQAALAADCKPFFAAASKPPVATRMRMHGMNMLDASSGPLPLVCLTINDPWQPPLFTGIGTPTIQVSSDRNVQSYFDQGLRFYMGFNNRESYRAFRFAAATAASVGPPCAWCYWGAALPLGSDINMPDELDHDRLAANQYLAQARALKPTGLLARLIQATAKRSMDCPSGDTPEECRQRRSVAYYNEMLLIRRDNLDDPNVGVLFADSILNLTPWHLPDRDKFEQARNTLETLLGKYSEHNGLMHWYIHLMELSPEVDHAEAWANELEKRAPKAGHLVHMPSHIYYRMGDMARAIGSNVRASKADETYFDDPNNQLDHPDGDRYRYGYYPHTLHFLAAAATLLGDRGSLADATKRLWDAPPPLEDGGYRKDKYREVYYLARVNFASPAEIRAFMKPEASPESRVQPRGNAAYAYAQVMADLWEGKAPTDTLPKFNAAVREYPEIDRTNPDTSCLDPKKRNRDTGLCVVAIENNLVQGRLAAFQGAWGDALKFTRQAVVLQTVLSYDEPPDWLYSLRQSYAAILIRRAAQDPSKPESQAALAEAKKELLTSLNLVDPYVTRSDIFPGSGWAYFGLWQVAQYLKGEDEAAALKAFESHWAGVPPPLDRM
jgi:hypothetical protein